MLKVHVLVIALILVISCVEQKEAPEVYPLDDTTKVDFVNVQGKMVSHAGKVGLEVHALPSAFEEGSHETMVILSDETFTDGTITLEVAGGRAEGARESARGFVGVAFRVDPKDYASYECIYLRPANGRAENQLQRNHSVQYISHPEHPWFKLRKEHPGLYESLDLELDTWTRMKVEVEGSTAKLFVHGESQPTLIVKDLKKGNQSGLIGLWQHRSTLARFRNIEVLHSE